MAAPENAVPDDDTAAAVGELLVRIEDEDGAPPLSDQAHARLRSDSVSHLIVRDGDQVVGYGQRLGEELELAAATAEAAGTILDAIDTSVLVWSHGTHSRLAPVFEQRRFVRARELLQLRRPGDVAVDDDPPLASDITVRAFVPGHDEDAWLAVNAAAFANHPEQGRMTLADLRAREAEEWFDPAGFLLAERDGELLGFHWTKVHPDGAGEVYVLGVSPTAQGLGLGRALLVRGLRHLLRNERPYLLLYVEGDNVGAVRLYEHELFTRHDVDIQWRTP